MMSCLTVVMLQLAENLVCVCVCVAPRIFYYVSLKVSHVIFLHSLSFFFCPSVSCFSPSVQAFRNALNVLIFAHANTRAGRQQRLNSSADHRPRHTLASRQPTAEVVLYYHFKI